MATTVAELSSRTTAACAGCAWTADRLTNDLSTRVAARQHTDESGHSVAVLTNTVALIEPIRGQRVP